MDLLRLLQDRGQEVVATTHIREEFLDHTGEHGKAMLEAARVTVISPEEAEEVTYVVCSLAGSSPFTDNVLATCCRCERAIMHRPHVPAKPRKICIECVAEQLAGGTA